MTLARGSAEARPRVAAAGQALPPAPVRPLLVQARAVPPKAESHSRAAALALFVLGQAAQARDRWLVAAWFAPPLAPSAVVGAALLAELARRLALGAAAALIAARAQAVSADSEPRLVSRRLPETESAKSSYRFPHIALLSRSHGANKRR